MTSVLTPAQERALYDRDREAWRVHAAPRLAARLAAEKLDTGLFWSLLTRETQLAVWPLLDESTQARVRAAREDLAE